MTRRHHKAASEWHAGEPCGVTMLRQGGQLYLVRGRIQRFSQNDRAVIALVKLPDYEMLQPVFAAKLWVLRGPGTEAA